MSGSTVRSSFPRHEPPSVLRKQQKQRTNMIILNAATWLDPEPVQSISFVTTYLCKYATSHAHTMPIHHYQAGSKKKRQRALSPKQQTHVFPTVRTRRESFHIPSHHEHGYIRTAPPNTVHWATNPQLENSLYPPPPRTIPMFHLHCTKVLRRAQPVRDAAPY
jgi:hypothetical protein